MGIRKYTGSNCFNYKPYNIFKVKILNLNHIMNSSGINLNPQSGEKVAVLEKLLEKSHQKKHAWDLKISTVWGGGVSGEAVFGGGGGRTLGFRHAGIDLVMG